MADSELAQPQSPQLPARQVLSALKRACRELEGQIDQSYEYAAKLNDEMQRCLSAQRAAASDKIERSLRDNFSVLSFRKLQALSLLADLQREELAVLQNTAKDLRRSMLERVDELVSSCAKATADELVSLQEELEKFHSGISGRIENGEQLLSESLPALNNSMRQKFQDLELKTEQSYSSCKGNINSALSESLNLLGESSRHLCELVQGEGQSLLNSFGENVSRLQSEQSEHTEKSFQALRDAEQGTVEQFESLISPNISFANNCPDEFRKSSSELAEIGFAMQSATANNFALQCNAEIRGALQEAENKMQSLAVDFQTSVQQCQFDYAKQSKDLLEKFKSTAEDLVCAASAPRDLPLLGDDVFTIINEQCNSTKMRLSDSAREKISMLQSCMQKSREEFRTVLENLRSGVSEKIERSFRESVSELERFRNSNLEKLKSMNQKIEELEQSVAEAKELISALDFVGMDISNLEL